MLTVSALLVFGWGKRRGREGGKESGEGKGRPGTVECGGCRGGEFRVSELGGEGRCLNDLFAERRGRLTKRAVGEGQSGGRIYRQVIVGKEVLEEVGP